MMTMSGCLRVRLSWTDSLFRLVIGVVMARTKRVVVEATENDKKKRKAHDRCSLTSIIFGEYE